MKKLSKVLLCLLSICLLAVFLSTLAGAEGEPGAYAVYQYDEETEKGTLTFCTGTLTGNGVERVNGDLVAGEEYLTGFLTETYEWDTPWIDYCDSITDVVFLDAIAPQSMASWFVGLYNLQTITGLEKINTANVTSMEYLFAECQALTSLDLRGWNTANVRNMGGMFYYCAALTSLELRGWNTANVTDMQYMFYDCDALTSLDLRGWNTANVTDMQSMFASCTHLADLKLGNFNTENVETMDDMFNYCKALSALDLSSFVIGEETTAYGMFSGCTALSSLTLGEHFLFSANMALPNPPQSLIYTGYWVLKNGNGTQYSSAQLMAQYSAALAGEWIWERPIGVYAVYTQTDQTMTFVFGSPSADGIVRTADGETYAGDKYYSGFLTNTYTYSNLPWAAIRSNVTTVTFLDPVAPTSTANWFNSFTQLTTINGMENLNTGNVTDMSVMFANCSRITSLDLSSLDTGNVTTMAYMFRNCSMLTELDLSSFDTSRVTNMLQMLFGCSALTTLKLGPHFAFQTNAGLQNLSDAFPYYGNWVKQNGDGTQYTSSRLMTEYDGATMSGTWVWVVPETATYAVVNETAQTLTFLTGAPTAEGIVRNGVTYAGEAYYAGFLTETYDGNAPWTRYSGDAITKVEILDEIAPLSMATWFADMYNLQTLTGLDKINTANVTSMEWLFGGCQALTSLDLRSWNTANVTCMGGMFSGCEALTSLDLRGWNTANVIDMQYMFDSCIHLADLKLGNFNTENVEMMDGMFHYCEALSALDLSSFVIGEGTSLYEMFDGCIALSSLTLGENFSFPTDAMLPDPPQSSIYTGYWVLKNGNGAQYSSEELMEQYSAALAGEWIWERPIDVYAVYTQADQTLTFVFGYPSADGIVRIADGETYTCDSYYSDFLTNTYTNSTVPWKDVRSNVTTVTFLDSVAPQSTAYWFYGFTKLTEMNGLENLNTGNVSDMQFMFAHCFVLREPDVSHFSTGNVAIMNAMFFNCSAFRTLNLSSFTTENVTDMNNMFKNCTALDTLTLGENFTFKTDAALPDANNAFPFTGLWTNTSGDGTAYTAVELMADYHGAEMAGTYVWEKTTRDLSEATVSCVPQTYTGTEKTTTVTVYWNDTPLVEGEDYEITGYENNINAGAATVTVSGIGNYTGAVTGTFTILPVSLAEAVVTAEDQTYTGQKLYPPVTVTLGDKILTEDVDYSVEYKNNVKAGTATVTVIGVGNYTDEASGSFAITKNADADDSPSNGFSLLEWLRELFRKIAALFKRLFHA